MEEHSIDTNNNDMVSTVHPILCYGDSLTAGTTDDAWALHPYALHLERCLNIKAAKDFTETTRIRYVVLHHGMPGWTASSMVDAADDPCCGLRSAIRAVNHPSLRCVILLAGTNDLGCVGNREEADRVAKIVSPIQALHEMAWNEGVEITVAVAVPPSGYQDQVSEAAALAEAVNQELKNFCDNSGGKAVFVSFPFDYEREGENWSLDTLHCSPLGYQRLGEYLAGPLMEVLTSLDE